MTAAYGAATRATVNIRARAHQSDQRSWKANWLSILGAHPDADIYLSQPGIGVILGARVLGEFGDDPNRFTYAKCRKNYAGTSPVTIASGRKHAVMARTRAQPAALLLDRWAFATLKCSPGARAFYDQHRAARDTHHQSCAPWLTASSASCMVACATTPSTTKTPPGLTEHQPPQLQLDS